MGDIRVNSRQPNNLGWFEVDLSDEIIDYLWKISYKSKKKENSMKHRLAGNITQSYKLIDENNYFWEKVLYHLTSEYFRSSGNKYADIYPHIDESSIKPRFTPLLKDFWVNFSKQHEFNPKHDHSGVYSFVIWMKIPYTNEEQSNLDFQKGLKETDKKAGVFEFFYYDMLGRQTSHVYKLGKEFDGKMVLFPSKLSHQVYHYYNSDEERVSISGNVWLKNVSEKEFQEYVDKNEKIVREDSKSKLKEMGIIF